MNVSDTHYTFPVLVYIIWIVYRQLLYKGRRVDHVSFRIHRSSLTWGKPLKQYLDYFYFVPPSKYFHRPVRQRVRLLAARTIRHVIKDQHHLVDENDEASEEKPPGQLERLGNGWLLLLFRFDLNQSSQVVVHGVCVDIREIILS